MAYEKQTWECGDVISAEKMNHMEDGIANAGGGGDAGYECVEGTVTEFEGSVTPSDEGGNYIGAITTNNPLEAQTITVYVDGEKYEMERVTVAPTYYFYGELDENTHTPTFTHYPIFITPTSRGNSVKFKTLKEYNIKIEQQGRSVNITDCFSAAVNKAVDLGYECDGDNVKVTNCFEKAVKRAMPPQDEQFLVVTRQGEGYTPAFDTIVYSDVPVLFFEDGNSSHPARLVPLYHYETSSEGEDYKYVCGEYTETVASNKDITQIVNHKYLFLEDGTIEETVATYTLK